MFSSVNNQVGLTQFVPCLGLFAASIDRESGERIRYFNLVSTFKKTFINEKITHFQIGVNFYKKQQKSSIFFMKLLTWSKGDQVTSSSSNSNSLASNGSQALKTYTNLT